MIEFDRHSIDEQSAFHLHLGELCPLVCMVHRGGKSLHGWYLVDGQPERKVREFFEYAVRLGTDTATWNQVQFVRMPGGGRRDDQDKPDKPQTVYYLNFNVLNMCNNIRFALDLADIEVAVQSRVNRMTSLSAQ